MSYDRLSYERLTGGQMQYNETHVNKLNAEIERLKAEGEYWTKENSTVREGNEWLTAINKRYEIENDTLRARVEELEVVLRMEIDLIKERDALRAEKESLLKQRAERNTIILELRAELEQIKQSYKITLPEGITVRMGKTVTERKLAEAEAENARLKAGHLILNETLATTSDEVIRLHKELDESESDVQELRDKLVTIEDERDSLKAELAEVERQRDHNSDFIIARMKEIDALQAELAATKPVPVEWSKTYQIITPYEVVKVFVKYVDRKLVRAEVVG